MAVSSANISGQKSPTSVNEAERQLGRAVSVYLDDGESPVGEASTIVDLSGPHPVVCEKARLVRNVLRKYLNCRRRRYAERITNGCSRNSLTRTWAGALGGSRGHVFGDWRNPQRHGALWPYRRSSSAGCAHSTDAPVGWSSDVQWFLLAVALAMQLPALNRGFMPVTPEMTAVLWSAFAIVLVGVLDDLFDLSAIVKLVGQIVAASLMSMLGLTWTLLFLPIGDGTTVVLDQVQSLVLTVFLQLCSLTQ